MAFRLREIIGYTHRCRSKDSSYSLLFFGMGDATIVLVRKIMNRLIAIILALVISNPLCCCAFGLGDCGQGQSTETSSCCQSNSSGNQENSDDEGCCSCMEKAGKRVAYEVEKFSTPTGIELGSFIPSTQVDELPSLNPVVAVRFKWPPGCEPYISPRSRLYSFCSFLI